MREGLLVRHWVEEFYRCFLFLVNYARMKPDVAMKALPVLVLVSSTFRDTVVLHSGNQSSGYG